MILDILNTIISTVCYFLITYGSFQVEKCKCFNNAQLEYIKYFSLIAGIIKILLMTYFIIKINNNYTSTTIVNRDIFFNYLLIIIFILLFIGNIVMLVFIGINIKNYKENKMSPKCKCSNHKIHNLIFGGAIVKGIIILTGVVTFILHQIFKRFPVII